MISNSCATFAQVVDYSVFCVHKFAHFKINLYLCSVEPEKGKVFKDIKNKIKRTKVYIFSYICYTIGNKQQF